MDPELECCDLAGVCPFDREGALRPRASCEAGVDGLNTDTLALTEGREV